MEYEKTTRRRVTHGETVLTAGASRCDTSAEDMSRDASAGRFCFTVRDRLGIHARPAAELVKLAKSFPAQITVSAKGKKASAASILELMALNAGQGTELCVEASGEQSVQALEAVRRFMDERL